MNRRFFIHYAEMVAAMFLGMLVLMPPAGALFSALGTSWSDLSPALSLFAMTVTMALPMAAWMRYRGHAWRPNLEMVGSMFAPTLVLMGLLGANVVRDGGAVTGMEHPAMLAAMLGAMLLRRDDYSGAAHAA
jgi:hypothetical protein